MELGVPPPPESGVGRSRADNAFESLRFGLAGEVPVGGTRPNHRVVSTVLRGKRVAVDKGNVMNGTSDTSRLFEGRRQRIEEPAA